MLTLLSSLIEESRCISNNIRWAIEKNLRSLVYTLNIGWDYDFLMELLTSSVGKNIIFSFLYYLEESDESLIKFSDIILKACENCIKDYDVECNRDYMIEQSLSKLILALYDSLYGTSKVKEKLILSKCLDLWDLMYENRIGTTRELSNGIMDR